MSKRLRQLDMLKLLSCVAVIGLHTLNTSARPVIALMYQLCAFAVPCFFLSSGYVLLNRKSVSYGYCLSKLLRILRVVAVWHILYYLIALLWGVLVDGQSLSLWWEYAKNCGKGILRGLLQKGPFWQFWYLGALAIVYLLLPPLSRLFNAPKGPRYAVIAWCALAAVSVGVYALSLLRGSVLQEKLPQTLRLWTWLQYFVLGGLFPRLVEWVRQRLSLWLHWVSVAVVTAVGTALRVWINGMVLQGSRAEYFYDAPLTILWVVLIATLILRIKLPAVLDKAAGLLTPLTMGVYIVHIQVRGLLRGLCQPEGTVALLLFASGICVISFVFVYIIRKLSLGRLLTEL